MSRGGASILLALIVASVGCGSDPTDPTGTLHGEWGSPDFEFVAGYHTAALHLPCEARARFKGPITLDGAGHFAVAGVVEQQYGGGRVRILGQRSDAGLAVTLEFTYEGGGGETKTAFLRPGVKPDFSRAVCLA